MTDQIRTAKKIIKILYLFVFQGFLDLAKILKLNKRIV